MASTPGMPSARKLRRMLDLKYQPGASPIAYACMFILYLPLAALIVFSFNADRSISTWHGFSLKWYALAIGNENIQAAAINSMQIAVSAMILSTAIATAAALATTRVRGFTGLTAVFALINMPLMVPEIVVAIALLSFLSLVKLTTGFTLGFGNLILSHTLFCIPFAYMPIRARLQDMNLTLENAAQDLYATPWQACRYITLPLLTPGIVAGAMLSFIVSLDDVVITFMVAGPGETTLPILILSRLRRGITPEINALSTLMLVLSIVIITTLFFVLRKAKK